MNKKSLFGTSGIRGDAKKFFNNQFCFDIGRTFAIFLKKERQEGPIAIGMDPRGSSPKILEAIEQGISFEKRTIFDQGASPVPAINYILKVSPAAGSMMVSGSHIAADLNGIKFFAFGEEISKKQEQMISDSYFQIKNSVAYQKREIVVTEENRANEEYEEMLVKSGGDYPCWKAVVDPGNGAQSDLMPRVLSRLGLKVKTINDEPQKGFISRDTETEGVLEELQRAVIKNKADLGVAFDADGDRVVFVDEKGQFIPGDYSCSIVARLIPNDTIVTPINSSQVVDYLDKKVIRTRVGSPFVVEAMKNHDALFGFEGNGGGISAEIMYSRDGGSTTIKFLRALKISGKTVSKLVGELPKFFIFKEKVSCPSNLNQIIIKKAKKFFKGKIEEMDGLKIWTDQNTWILFRPSSNAPEFRVFTEAKTKVRASQMLEDGIQFVKDIIKEGKE